MNIHCISSIFLFFLLQSLCEGNFDFTHESSELVKGEENALHIVQGRMKGAFEEHHCKCSSEDCECCYNVGVHSICSTAKVVTLVDHGNDLAIQGRLSINNGSIFTCSIKFKEIPKMCYHHEKFTICFDLKHEEVETNRLKICGHIRTTYSTAVLLNADLFCKYFDITSVGDGGEQKESSDRTKSEENKFFSLYLSQLALQ